MERKFDINDFYMIEHICSRCGNICSKEDAACPVCGEWHIEKKTVSRSCLGYSICRGEDCLYSTHEELSVCPVCGSRTYNCDTMIAEDHWGLPIPPPDKCFGILKDDDEGAQHLRRLSSYAKRKKEI